MPFLFLSLSAVLTLIPFAPRPQNTTDPGMVVSLSWLRSHLDDKSVVVITTGNRAVYDRDHIPGARFIAHDDTIRMTGGAHYLLDPAALAPALSKAGARDDARIVLYGDSAMATGWLYMTLASIGHGAHVSMLDGNIDAWRAAGHPVSTDVPAAATGRLTPAAAPGIVVDAPWVKSHLDDNRRASSTRARSASGTPAIFPKRRSSSGRISSRISNCSRSSRRISARAVQAGRRRRQLAGRDVLRDRHAREPMYFAARYAGIPAQVYVGSFEDWQRQGGYPVIR